MSFFGFFRRRPPVRSAAELADFVDEQSAFLAQKGIFEYSRARAGPYAKVLFREPAFLEAVEGARWRAYPLALAMVAEAVDAALRHGTNEPQALHSALNALVLSVFDRYPVPASLGAAEWEERRQSLARDLGLIAMHSPKKVPDIPERFAKPYFALMPIHERLRGSDFPTIRNYLRVTLCNIHDELTQRSDTRALAALLVDDAAATGGAA
ncbi:MAG: hypothetical protein R3D62_09930 [Xanthobacteraceae bacterium]